MTASHAAMKKDLDLVEQRLQNYVLMPKFVELQHQCMDYADKKDIARLDKEDEKMKMQMTRYIARVDVQEKFKKMEKEVWEELAIKLEKKTFERKIESFEQDRETQFKGVQREITSIREVIDRIRKRQEEFSVSIHQLNEGLDEKMAHKEGKKIWTNFRKYAQYDELQTLYKKVLPAISSFEDKLKDTNDKNERIDLMIRRLDELICLKADRTTLKEFKDFAKEQYITFKDNDKTLNMVEIRVSDFGERVDQVEDLVKFQGRQIQKEMYSAIRRIINQHQQKDENQPVSMKTVVEHVKSVVACKAEKQTVESLVTEKANKVDTEMCLRWVDLLHKMVNKVVLLLTTKLKVDLDVGIDTANNRQNKKVQLLQQGLIISKWIESFDSQNINDFYFMTEKEKQPNRIH